MECNADKGRDRESVISSVVDDVEVEVDAGRESTSYEYEGNGVGTMLLLF